jgi:cytochrome c oxidase cbb3-type subunit 1
MHPMYVIRALGGAMFLVGALIMAFNFYKTLTARASAVGEELPPLAGVLVAPAE